ADEPLQVPTHGHAGVGGGELRGGAPPEHPADRRRASERVALGFGEPVEARTQEGVDGRRYLEVGEFAVHDPTAVVATQPAILDEDADHLLDEQRRTLGGLDDSIDNSRLHASAYQQLGDESAGLGVTERAERDRRRVLAWREPRGTQLADVGAGRAEENDRRRTAPRHEVL